MDDKTNYKIAVASTDGIVINSHFGRANKFYVYEVGDEDSINFVEIRKVVPVCAGGNHDNHLLKKNIDKFNDCKYLIVSRVGEGPLALANSQGIEIHEIPGEIEESINQLIKYKKVQALFN